MTDLNTKISKKLTWLLRHGDPNITGLNIRCDGFAQVTEILKQFDNLSLKELIYIVNNDPKYRFALVNENNELLIRANQGHSFPFIDDEKLLKRIGLNKNSSFIERLIIHGTYLDKWEVIKRIGLSRMNRSHIHFVSASKLKLISKNSNSDKFIKVTELNQIIKEFCNYKLISGIRSSANILIFIDMGLVSHLDKSLIFYVAENGIILSRGNKDGFISSELFLFCVDIENGSILLNNIQEQDLSIKLFNFIINLMT